MSTSTTFINTLKQRLHLNGNSKWLRRSMWGVIPLVGAASFYAVSQVAAPVAINLSAEPLYAKGTGAKPTISLALSVEFPTVGAQYRDNYTVANEYIGYFDADSCYTYNNNADASLRRFDRTGAATAHTCGGTGFSGNFMNWATSSAIDVLRLGLTGGDRIKDETNLTILQRAVIQNNFFNNGTYFPAKNLPSALVDGAVPNTLKGTYTGDIKIANCLNRVHFGTTQAGSCDAPGANSNLGVAVAAAAPPAVVSHTGALATAVPSGYSGSSCANNGGTCSFTGTKYVAYGKNTTWKIGVFTSSTACKDSVFGNTGVSDEKCYVGSSWVAPTPAPTLSADNFFYTRVRVCEAADPRNAAGGFCLKYASGNAKPVGNLQKYSDRVRVAAFGYLKDDVDSRYGGVLRAPMKYLGPNTYDQSGALQTGVNAKVEWDPTTGVFTTNPEGATEGISGVVNYLNQFGRTATVPGAYKSFDPVSELYYEALRYVQGLPPTPAATSGMTTAMKDGYPVIETWIDPHAGGDKDKNYSCVKNNIVLVGDVNVHSDKTIPGNTRTNNNDLARTYDLAKNEPNFFEWTKVVGGFESNNPVSYPFGNLATNPTTSNPNTTVNAARWGMESQNTGSGGKGAYYMAGMAYWGNTQDIRGKTWTNEPAKQRPGMRTKTYVIDVNEGSANNVEAARRNTQFFLTAKYGGFTDKSGKGNPYLNASGQLDNNNWQKSADPGEAKTYFLASSAKAVLTGLNEIFDSIATEGNSIANGSISTTSFATGGYVYNATFDPTDWSGDVISTPVIASGGAVNVAVATPQWKAASVMNANSASYFASTRKIFAGRALGNSSGAAAITFNWSGVSGDAALLAALNKPSATAAADGLAQDRVNYLRGDKSKEGTPFRTRSSLLGDIVNSPVVYSKEFSDNVNTQAYKDFKALNLTRPGALYVGANDGMFHAFNSATGAELFAYIPSWIAGKLPALTDPTYNSSKHQSYVDGPTDVSEALVGTTWKTVLLSSTGGGGQGVFALDVSNPATFNTSNVMWEFTDRDDADLGNVIGTPRVVKIQTNKKATLPTDPAPVYEWFAVVPSGVNNFVADGFVSTTKKPHLFLLSLNKPAGTAWGLGTNYFKFEVTTNDTLSTTVSPGVINFDATTGSAGELDQLYMGDLHGNLWKLDFDNASSGASGKNLASVTFSDLIAGTSNKPLFVAKDDAGNVQPIAITPKLVFGPNKGTIVMFGTGKYMESSDNNLTPVRTQSVYAINDVEVSGSSPKFVAGRAFLKKGTSVAGVISVDDFIWGRAGSASDSSQRSGWYFDYATAGERSVSDFTVSGAKVYFGSVVPPQNLTDPCNGGGGNIYGINFATGDGSGQVSTVGLIGQIFVQQTVASTISPSDSTGRRTEKTTERMLIKGTDGFQMPPDDIIRVTALGRLSWRQINNYYELKNATP
jgi:type IV pilus assembly protein PilY1